MRRLSFGIVLLLAGLLCLTQAQSQLLGVLKGPSTPAGYQGPGDIVSGALFFGGLYAYNAAYATGSNPGADICDAATLSTCTTVNILATGYFDDATAAALPQCASACAIGKLYDQTGNGHHLQPSGGVALTAPDLTFATLSGRAVITFNGSSDVLIVQGGVVQPTQPFSTYVVYKTAIVGSIVYWEGPGGSNVIQVASGVSPDSCGTYAGTGGVGANAASSGVWHACTAVFNSGSTFAAIDSVVGTPGNTGSNNPGDIFYVGAGFPQGTGQFFSGTAYGVIVYGSALSSGQATALNVNAHTIGGF